MTHRDGSLSVVIPTHNRCVSLRRTLDALARQSVPADQFEVLVVLDGCTDDTAAEIARYAAPYCLRTIEQSQHGPGAARNRGAEAAEGEWLVFFDDDVVPSPECLAAHRAAHGDGRDRVIIGPYLPFLSSEADYPEMALRAWWYDKFRAMRHPAHHFGYEDCLSGNCSLSRELFIRVGGFDANFPCAHEDYELGVRLLKTGATLRYCDSAHALHDLKSTATLARMFQRTRLEARGDALIGARHPELRSALPISQYAEPRTRLSRLMHSLAFNYPRLGDYTASILRAMLTLLQRLQRRRRWQRLYQGLTNYWYLRGLADVLQTPHALQTFLDDHPLDSPTDAEGDTEPLVDLSDGLTEALEQVDRLRARGLRVVFGSHMIGRISPRAGREPIRGVHLQAVLATDFLWPLFAAVVYQAGLGDDTVIPSPTHVVGQDLTKYGNQGS